MIGVGSINKTNYEILEYIECLGVDIAYVKVINKETKVVGNAEIYGKHTDEEAYVVVHFSNSVIDKNGSCIDSETESISNFNKKYTIVTIDFNRGDSVVK